jgi:hypothetical protein
MATVVRLATPAIERGCDVGRGPAGGRPMERSGGQREQCRLAGQRDSGVCYFLERKAQSRKVRRWRRSSALRQRR